MKLGSARAKARISRNHGRRLRNVIISIVVLLLLTVGGGVGYTWYMGKYHAPKITPDLSAPTERLPDPFETLPKLAPDAVVGASVQMITSPIAPGTNALVTAKTNPDAECKITVVYGTTPSTDSGLSPRTADEYGMVSWTWTVGSEVPLGKWPVTITCANQKNSAVVKTELIIKKAE